MLTPCIVNCVDILNPCRMKRSYVGFKLPGLYYKILRIQVFIILLLFSSRSPMYWRWKFSSRQYSSKVNWFFYEYARRQKSIGFFINILLFRTAIEVKRFVVTCEVTISRLAWGDAPSVTLHVTTSHLTSLAALNKERSSFQNHVAQIRISHSRKRITNY